MPRYVILEHDHPRLHWDLMLEAGDVLRTWAIDAPVVAGADLPARALPDHRRIYLDYEGDISENRGTVRRIDRGTYESRVWGEDYVRVLVQGDQLVGEVEIRQSASGPEACGKWVFRLGNVD